MFASRSKSAAGNIQVVTLIHVYLAARATVLEITEQLKTVESPPQALLVRVHALRILELRMGTSIVAINVRQFQASQPAQVVRRWADSLDALRCSDLWGRLERESPSPNWLHWHRTHSAGGRRA